MPKYGAVQESNMSFTKGASTHVCVRVFADQYPVKKKKTSKLLSLLCNLLTMKRSATYC